LLYSWEFIFVWHAASVDGVAAPAVTLEVKVTALSAETLKRLASSSRKERICFSSGS
jgi:hypothetical protein